MYVELNTQYTFFLKKCRRILTILAIKVRETNYYYNLKECWEPYKVYITFILRELPAKILDYYVVYL